MKILKYPLLCMVTISLVACADFLQREPIDFTDESVYLNSTSDMALYMNGLYDSLPKMSTNFNSLYMRDNNSDNQAGVNPNALFYQGDKLVPSLSNSAWNFTVIRTLNYYINRLEPNVHAGTITGSQSDINHYMGEAYFFKAYDYFRLLYHYGDVPIIDEVLPEDLAVLIAASRRRPRNEVARYILALCDKAADNLYEVAPASGRICKDAALLLKARVALFEATWEKYHEGTCFVPGNNKWVGKANHPNFSFPSGSDKAEVEFFFEQAIAAADAVAGKRSLHPNYAALFVDPTGALMNQSEVILARYYQLGVNAHAASHYLYRSGSGTGFTRSLIESFLTNDGLPIYADSTYKGDAVMYDMLQNRDIRLTSSVKTAGFVVAGTDTIVDFKPLIYFSGNQSNTTGYSMRKWMSEVPEQNATVTSGTTATPIFRAAEAYLIYLEAYYERYGNLGGNCDRYWKALRTRAGIDADYTKTIAATDLTKENDLATHSRGRSVDATLYNIRRERRSEFIAEGLRLQDLKRWRALDGMQNYHMEGANLWADLYKIYTPDQIREGDIVSSRGISTYLSPYRIVPTNVAYNGYNFPKPHYLEPIPVSEIILNTPTGTSESTIYQNPGWPVGEGRADYSYDCD